MSSGRSRPQLSADVLGQYEQETWWLPLWVSMGAASFLLLVVVLDVVRGHPGGALVPALGAVALLLTGLVRHRNPPVVSTEVSSDGVVVRSTGGKRDVVRWEDVAGVRVFRRYSRPQVVLADGSPVQLLAVPDEVARSLAASCRRCWDAPCGSRWTTTAPTRQLHRRWRPRSDRASGDRARRGEHAMSGMTQDDRGGPGAPSTEGQPSPAPDAVATRLGVRHPWWWIWSGALLGAAALVAITVAGAGSPFGTEVIMDSFAVFVALVVALPGFWSLRHPERAASAADQRVRESEDFLENHRLKAWVGAPLLTGLSAALKTHRIFHHPGPAQFLMTGLGGVATGLTLVGAVWLMARSGMSRGRR